MIKNELKDSNLYLNDHNRFNKITNELVKNEEALDEKETRWLELMEMEQSIN